MGQQYRIDRTPSDEANMYWIGLGKAMERAKDDPIGAYQAIISGGVVCAAAQLRAIEWRMHQVQLTLEQSAKAIREGANLISATIQAASLQSDRLRKALKQNGLTVKGEA